jgi:hypothetical protein
MTMGLFLMLVGLAIILPIHAASKRRRNAKGAERAMLNALRKVRAEARAELRSDSPPVGRIIFWQSSPTWQHDGTTTT